VPNADPRANTRTSGFAYTGTGAYAYTGTRTSTFADACAGCNSCPGRNAGTGFQSGSGSIFKSATGHTGCCDNIDKLEHTACYFTGNRLIDSGLQRRELQRG
jgi:hypothetical protein